MDFGALMFFTDYAISGVDLAKALEERGFESVWAGALAYPAVAQNAISRRRRPAETVSRPMDPFVSLTAAAVATTKLKVGTGVCLVRQRDPIRREAAAVD